MTDKTATRIVLYFFISLFLFCGFAVCGIAKLRQKTWKGIGVAYKDVNIPGNIKLFIPPEAEEISYCYRLFDFTFVAAFKISEKDFVDWAKKQEWGLRVINEPNGRDILDVYSTETADHYRGDIKIKIGYLHLGFINQRLLIQFAYDKEKGIGYFSSFGEQYETNKDGT